MAYLWRMALSAALAKRAEHAAKAKLARITAQAHEDIALVQRRKRDIEDAFYDIGLALRRLKAPEIVRALGHRTFADLCSKQLAISLTQAERLITIVERMGRDEAAKLGASKAAALIGLVDATRTNDSPAGALARGVRLPSGKRLDAHKASAREIERAAKEARQANPKHDKRGRHVAPSDQAIGERLAKKLRALGCTDAKVTVLAGAPGKGARVRVEGVEISKLRALAKAISAL